MPTDLPLIAWADVPEGPVWFKWATKWKLGIKRGGCLLEAGTGVPNYPPFTDWQFTPAEQGPGALAAECDAKWAAWGVVEVAIRNQSVSDYMNHWEGRTLKAEADLTRLRAEVDELRQRDKVISRQLERRASGDDPLANALRADRDKFEEEAKRLRDGLAALEQQWRTMTADARKDGPICGDEIGHEARWTAVEMCADELLAALREGQTNG